MAAPLAPGRVTAPVGGVPPRRIVFFDERYADSCAFAQAFEADQAVASAQDVARLWYGGLQADARTCRLQLAGLTLPSDHMLLAGFAEEAGLTLHFETWHDGRGPALTHHITRGSLPAALSHALRQTRGEARTHGRPAWARTLALALRSELSTVAVPPAAGRIVGAAPAADMPGMLVSWLIA
ncbi:hypothetical protein [Aquabacterium sp.]|uniref:hypothetical protein n=1 Tax=Aquabacterium sp. TaxID=1872578 RepID=UPI002C511B47|nr:hypothetical protein [Aquabacterium sp.]HSW06770.1 hypothetical protein [Aquabacterium sp.]